ncbi:MAG TPA: GGDEF domain-containing protein [Gaiellaceae bacterium]|nr:GGDEF domain-containing protein [Gaiellaceae bacterium]
MILARIRGAGASVVAAALLVGASIGVATFALEAGIVGSQRTAWLNDVRDTLSQARILLVDRQQTAVHAATALAASPRVQRAFATHDAATLRAVARTHPAVSFVLWNGHTAGRPPIPGLGTSVAVYAAGALAGRVVVATRPDSALLAGARTPSSATRLAFVVGERIVAAVPALPYATTTTRLLSGTLHDQIALDGSPSAPTRIVGYRDPPRVPLEWLWPTLLGLAALAISFVVFERREHRRRAEPPPNTVRDAVALVGETLAATHNPDALLPVILQAAVEATNAAGGTITAGGRTIVARGHVAAEQGPLEVGLDVPQGPPATLTLYPPPHGFGVDARDAAAWIAAQAVIALENARLHGLVQRQAVTDELTGLANRRRFLSQLELEVTRSRRSGSPLGIVLADLDDFKRVNDTYGHEVGDDALRGFAEILRSTVRDVDLPVRLGGEEFAVLLPDTDLAGAAQLAERLREALEKAPLRGPRGELRLTASFGVSCFPVVAAADELLADADRRLYEAKRRGKNRVVAPSQPGPPSGRPVDV